jgi:hypothetical protein
MMFATKCLAEPDLEFGDGGRHIDPRYGLMTHGPLQAKAGDLIRIGVIGTSETVDGMAQFMERAMTGIESANDRLGNLNPGFPGMGNQNPFRYRFEVEAGATRTVLNKDVKAIKAIVKHPDAVRAAGRHVHRSGAGAFGRLDAARSHHAGIAEAHYREGRERLGLPRRGAWGGGG